jgi:hypothetical protein
MRRDYYLKNSEYKDDPAKAALSNAYYYAIRIMDDAKMASTALRHASEVERDNAPIQALICERAADYFDERGAQAYTEMRRCWVASARERGEYEPKKKTKKKR